MDAPPHHALFLWQSLNASHSGLCASANIIICWRKAEHGKAKLLNNTAMALPLHKYVFYDLINEAT